MAQGTTRGVPIDTDPLLAADSDLLVASQKATKAYADTKQAALGFTPENVANKENATLDTSTTKYPTNNLVKTYADAKVTDAIVDGVTTIAPSQNAVFDALALKQNALGFTPENVANKSTSIITDQTSNTKYPSVKAVYDWAVGAFTTTSAVASQITTALVGYATQSWVTSQGYITNVITALGYTPENVANKQSALSTSAAHYYNAPYINSVLVARIFIASDQTTTSNAAANITGLVTATLAANKTYIVRGVISVTSAAGAAGGTRIGATLPTGATSIIFISGRGNGTTMTQETSIDGALQTTASNRIANAASDLIISGNITTSSTAGTVQFRFASGTNGQSNSVIAARTYIEIFEKL